MHRAFARRLIVLGAMVGGSFASTVSSAQTTQPQPQQKLKQPNVVVILADDMGYGDLSCFRHDPANVDGAALTPHIDSLAAQGVKFTNAYSMPMCSPARAALLTGRYPQRFGFYGNADAHIGLPKDEILLPQLMKQNGYATACIGKWHVGHQDGFRPLDRGFDRFYGMLGASHDYFKASVGTDTDGPMYEGSHVWDQDKKVEKIKYLTTQLTDEALGFIDGAQKANKPFFLYLAYNAPHGPEQAEPETEKEFARFPNVRTNARTTVRAMLDSLDKNVGRIQRELFLRGIADDTLIVFAADNGGNEYEEPTYMRTVEHNGGLRGRKFTVWEGGLRVPLIMRWTRALPQGVVDGRNVCLLDTFATAVSAAGGTLPAGRKYDSVDLVPFVTANQAAVPHEAIYGMMPTKNKNWSIRKGDWKLISESDSAFSKNGPKGPPSVSLFNLVNDPWERNNVFDKEPAKAAELRGARDAFVAECKPSIADLARKTGNEPDAPGK